MATDSAPEPLDPNFRITLPQFEGPLDLLLFLVQKHELNILDLPISLVTEKYLAYLGLMQQLNLDIAAEYVVMAATLAWIKSKMLLPPDPTQVDEDAAEGEEIDPRAELIRRLLEYQKYKVAAESLAARGMTGRDVFLRGTEPEEATGPAPLAEIGVFKLLDAFAAVLKRANKEIAFQVTTETVGIQERVTQIVELLKVRRTCRFDELFTDVATVPELVVTFLAILEMAKRRLMRIYQTDPIAPIHVEYRVIEEPTEPSANDGDDVDAAIARPGEDPLGEADEDAAARDEDLDDDDAAPSDDAEDLAPSGDGAEDLAPSDDDDDAAPIDGADGLAPSDEADDLAPGDEADDAGAPAEDLAPSDGLPSSDEPDDDAAPTADDDAPPSREEPVAPPSDLVVPSDDEDDLEEERPSDDE